MVSAVVNQREIVHTIVSYLSRLSQSLINSMNGILCGLEATTVEMYGFA
jgi:hypothetical protein